MQKSLCSSWVALSGVQHATSVQLNRSNVCSQAGNRVGSSAFFWHHTPAAECLQIYRAIAIVLATKQYWLQDTLTMIPNSFKPERTFPGTSGESNFLLGGCWMTYSFCLWCQQIILKNTRFQSTVQTSFLLHPLQGWITECNGFIFDGKKIFKRKRCRDMNWFSQWHQNDASAEHREECSNTSFPALHSDHRLWVSSWFFPWLKQAASLDYLDETTNQEGLSVADISYLTCQ